MSANWTTVSLNRSSSPITITLYGRNPVHGGDSYPPKVRECVEKRYWFEIVNGKPSPITSLPYPDEPKAEGDFQIVYVGIFDTLSVGVMLVRKTEDRLFTDDLLLKSEVESLISREYSHRDDLTSALANFPWGHSIVLSTRMSKSAFAWVDIQLEKSGDKGETPC